MPVEREYFSCRGRIGVVATYKTLLVPCNALLLVGIGVGVAVDGTSLTAEKTVQSRADLVALALLQGVALSATGGEELLALLEIT